MIRTPGFAAASSRSPIIPFVPGVSGTWTLMKSDSLRRVAMSARVTPSRFAYSSDT